MNGTAHVCSSYMKTMPALPQPFEENVHHCEKKGGRQHRSLSDASTDVEGARNVSIDFDFGR